MKIIFSCLTISNWYRFQASSTSNPTGWCTIVTTGNTYTVNRSLRYFVNQLPADIFFRSHKSYLVSLSYVKTISKRTLFVAGKPLPLSPRARACFYNRVLKIDNIKIVKL